MSGYGLVVRIPSVGDARLWGMHAYERHANEMAVYGMHTL
jgi:hypothetical protein